MMTEVLSFPRKRESRIKRFWIPNQVGDDNGCDFEDDSDDVIPHLMRNPKYIPSSNINKEKIGLDFLQYDITHFRKF